MSTVMLNGRLLSPTLTLNPTREELLALAKVDPKVEELHCNFCEHLESKKLTALSDMSAYGCKACRVGQDQRPRYLITKSDIATNPLITRPKWCPKQNNTTMVSHSLYSAKPRIKFSELKLNQVYVCPAMYGQPLRIIRIVNKYNTYCRGQVLNSGTAYDYVSIYESDVISRFLTPLLEVKSPFPK